MLLFTQDQWRVRTVTGTQFGAGTDADVFIQVSHVHVQRSFCVRWLLASPLLYFIMHAHSCACLIGLPPSILNCVYPKAKDAHLLV
jgi:hypothetical protein